VLLSPRPVSPCMPSGLHCTCYSLVYSLATQCRCLGFAPVPLSSTTAAVQMSGFLLLFRAPHNAPVIAYVYNMR
jgi:hypothetical protein